MKKYTYWILALFTILASCTVKKEHLTTKDVIALWNQKTISSIEEQISSTNNHVIKKSLQNDLKGAKLFLYSSTLDNEGKADKSPRTKFLKTVFPSEQKPAHFYVLEFVERGEQYQIKNVFIVNSERGSQIKSYQYYGNDWHLVADTIIKKIDLHQDLVRPLPLNSVDRGLLQVVLSEFEGTNIVSRFYPDNRIDKQNAFFEFLVKEEYFPYPRS